MIPMQTVQVSLLRCPRQAIQSPVEQKTNCHCAKGDLLAFKRRPITTQKAVFCEVKDGLLQHYSQLFENQHVISLRTKAVKTAHLDCFCASLQRHLQRLSAAATPGVQFFIMPVSPPRFTALRFTDLRSRPFESLHASLKVSMLPMSPLYERMVLCT